MRRTTYSVIPCLVTAILGAQSASAQFADPEAISNAVSRGPGDLADVDGDGDVDVLAAYSLDGLIAWHANSGDGSMGPRQPISTLVVSPRCARFADLDGDGDVDVVSASATDGKVAWYENLGGAVFAMQRVIHVEPGARWVEAGDLDGDADLDLVVHSSSSSTYSLWTIENLGAGVFGAAQAPATGNWSEPDLEDLDSDGDLDLLSGNPFAPGNVAWLENDGAGTFSGPQVIGSNVTRGRAVDMDGDGDLDVLAGSVWSENLGSGTFGSFQGIAGDFSLQAVGTVDVDGDGVAEAIGRAYDYTANPWWIGTAWLSNSVAGEIELQRVSPNPASGSAYAAGDLDGDGDDDVVYFGPGGTGWLRNLDSDAFGPRLTVAQGATGSWLGFYRPGLRSSDVDRDGDVDLVTLGLTGNLVWCENRGASGFVVRVIGPAANVSDIRMADLDGDGDDDVVASRPYPAETDVLWHENLGGGLFGPQSSLSTLIGSSGGLATSVGALETADLDGDGDLDLVCGNEDAVFPFTVAWIENLGGPGISFGSIHPIETSLYYASSLRAADMDGDGDMDVVADTSPGGKVSYENLGAGQFAPRQVFDSTWGDYDGLDVGDLDGDGDVDVVASSGSPGLVWYANDGAGALGPRRSIWSSIEGWPEVRAADLDADGDLDVVTSGSVLAWYENLGSGAFGPQAVISPVFTGPHLQVDDLDADGDPDVAYAAGNGVFWYENAQSIGSVFCTGELNSTGSGASLRASGLASVALDRVTLHAARLPLQAFGFFLASTTQGLTPGPGGSQGTLCLGGAIGRLVGPGQILNSASSGSFELELALQSIPSPTGFVAALPGDTWRFQGWYRDAIPLPTSNLTDALSITFR